MKNAPSIIVFHRCEKGAGCTCPGGTKIYIERDGRSVCDTIGIVVCEVMRRLGRRVDTVLIGWHDWHLLRNELGLSWSDDGSKTVLHTPIGEVKFLVDPAVERGVRALPRTGDYASFLNYPQLLEPR